MDCKSNLKGPLKQFSSKELMHADAFHNLSFDNGRTFPLRGKGVKKIRTLDYYLNNFNNQYFHLNPKDKSSSETEILIKYLMRVDKKRLANFFYWGSHTQYLELKRKVTHFGRFLTNGRQTMKCMNFLRLWGSILILTKLPKYCLRFKNITIDLDSYFSLGLKHLTIYFQREKIELWGYNVRQNYQLDQLIELGWPGAITPNIGDVSVK